MIGDIALTVFTVVVLAACDVFLLRAIYKDITTDTWVRRERDLVIIGWMVIVLAALLHIFVGYQIYLIFTE